MLKIISKFDNQMLKNNLEICQSDAEKDKQISKFIIQNAEKYRKFNQLDTGKKIVNFVNCKCMVMQVNNLTYVLSWVIFAVYVALCVTLMQIIRQ